MFLKKIIISLLTLSLSLSVCFGCNAQETPPDIKPEPEPNPPITADGRFATPTKHLLDSFDFGAGGFTESEFYINNNQWGYNNNGVKGESVGFTSDGIAVLKAYGDYTDKRGFKRSGSCLLSHEYVGPGLIEVAMKVMPRLGGCTAIWPFYAGQNDKTGEYQYQEIDIEIPAGAEENNGIKIPATFEKIMNTNYASTWKENGGGPVRSTKTETLTPTNDGEWHKYGIKWETDPKPRVRYYMDDVLTSDTNDDPDGYKTVSDATAPIQIGVWFPDGWAGDRDFDESCMLVDWVTYEPYAKQPRSESRIPETQSGIYPNTNYPLSPIALPEINYISNGDFESTSATDQTGAAKFAWQGDFGFDKLVDATSGKAILLNSGKSISQVITGVYGKTRENDKDFKNSSYYYTFDFSGNAVCVGECDAEIKIEFLDGNNRVIPSGTKTLKIVKSSDLALRVKSVNGSKAMKITASVSSGDVKFDNFKMLKVLKNSK